MSGPGKRWAPLLALVMALSAVGAPRVASADARTDYLVRLIRTSTAFRVRAQAALSLGRIEGDPAVVRVLSQTLGDEHPAVRAAAAASLEQLRDPAALPALRNAARDREASVRSSVQRAIRVLERLARSAPRTTPVPGPGSNSGPARYYVGVGMPGTTIQVSRASLASARQFIEARVQSIPGVIVAPQREANGAARRVLRTRRLTGYYLDSSIVRIEDRNGGTRAVVSIIVNTYPGRDMRVMLQGAATVQGSSGATAERQAIEGALTGALRRLPQAFAAGDARDGR
ncbi:MAG: hypothetical protein DRJ42_12530 [Deltaproteobacteria bacterium]|nr:MAG: hypothetical protein DRJ42_12530 [Deltaproteobacteria bacterium]